MTRSSDFDCEGKLRPIAMNDCPRSWLISPVVFGAWCVFVASITLATWGYDVAPGAEATVPEKWPSAPNIAKRGAGTGSRLLCFLHPKCGCSAVTVNCLKQLLAESGLNTAPQIVFVSYVPASHPEWAEEAILRSCRQIPGAIVLQDPDGDEARRFGITTSGHVLMYSNEGHLLFAGGLTASRGHAGPSAGQDALLKCLRTLEAADRDYPVFGCSIQSSGSSIPRRGVRVIPSSTGMY
jgi:hypothetical protein